MDERPRGRSEKAPAIITTRSGQNRQRRVERGLAGVDPPPAARPAKLKFELVYDLVEIIELFGSGSV